MLFLLIGLLLIAAGFTMMTKRNRESLFLMGMCCSLMVQFTGILIFIAKKGGYSKNIISFLFFSQTLRIKLQYLFITLDTLGYIIAIGRYLFPLFLLESALPDAAAAPAGGKKQTLYLKFPSLTSPELRHMKLVFTMFPGKDVVKLVMADSRKVLQGYLGLHDALLAECREVLGAENVVLK